MPLDTTWMDALPDVTLPGQATPAPAAPQQGYTDVIDVGGPRHSADVPAGDPGSELAPSMVGAGGKGGAPTEKPDTSWMDALPAVTLPKDQPQAPQSTVGGIVKNIGAGAVDAGAAGINTAIDPFGNLIGKPLATAAVFAHDAIAPMFGGKRFDDDTRNMLLGDNVPQQGTATMDAVGHVIGSTPPSEVPANGPMEQIARKATTNAALMAGGGPLAAAAGAGGAVVGDLASRVVPAWAAPATELAGNVVGGAAVGAAGAGVRGVAGAAGNQVRSFTAPLTQAGQQRLAGQRIAGAATDLGAVHEALNNPASQLVPDSEPTTFQATGDQGLGTLERVAAKNAPDQFIARNNAQNTARVAAVEAPQTTGDPHAVGEAFRGQLQAMDRANEAVAAGAQRNAQGATQAIGNAPPVGADAQASTLQRFGNTIRGKLNAVNQSWKAGNSTLYAAVDPDGTLTVDMRPFKADVAKIVKDRPKNLGPMPGDAGQVFGTAQMQPAVQKFSEVGALRQRIGDAAATEMRQNGSTQTYRYLTMLRGALDDTLSGAVAEKAAADAEAVRGGAMAPEDAIGARLSAQDANAGSALPAGNSRSDVGNGNRSGLPGEVSPGSGEHVSSERQQADAGGSPGVSAETADAVAPPEPTVTWNQGALDRRRIADAAHAERMQTLGPNVPGVGPALKPGSRPGDFKMGASEVPANLFMPGKGAAERIQAFQKAAARDPSMMGDLEDYAAFSFRRAAEDPDGTINVAKAQKWRDAHAEVMGAFPELAKKFDTAATARQALDDVTARQAANRTAYQTNAVSRLMGDADPVKTVGRVLGSDNAVAQMQDLARKTAGDPAARAGLRRAIVEHILEKLRSNTLAGDNRMLKNDAFQTFARNAAPALRTVFSADEVQTIQNVAADLQRSQKSVSGTKLQGGSNTPQDLAAGEKHGSHGPSILTSVIAAEAGGEVMGHLTGGIGKAAGMIVIPVVNAMRAHGMGKVDALVTQAMLNPALAKALLAKVPPSASSARAMGKVIATQIQALAATAAVTSSQRKDKP